MSRKPKREVDEIIKSTFDKIMALPDSEQQNEAAKGTLFFGSGMKVMKVLFTQEQSA